VQSEFNPFKPMRQALFANKMLELLARIEVVLRWAQKYTTVFRLNDYEMHFRCYQACFVA